MNISAPKSNEKLIKLTHNLCGFGDFFGATQNGSCFKWKDLDNVTFIKNDFAPLNDFDAHSHLPFLGFLPKNGHPFMTDMEGNTVVNFKTVQNGSCCAFHPVLPDIAFGTENGDLIQFKLNSH